jgi:hypothetical protein
MRVFRPWLGCPRHFAFVMRVLTNPIHPPLQAENAATVAPKRFALPPEVRRTGKVLLHQQCWFWGKDIKSPQGNLLIGYGFKRHPAPAEQSGCTAYRLRLPNKGLLLLWGFGFYCSQPQHGGVIVGRYEFRPRLTPLVNPPMPVWESEQIPGRTLPQTTVEFSRALSLLARALRALSNYEEWITGEIGLDYRRQLMQEWDRDYVPVEGIAETWLALAERCERRAAKLTAAR